MSLSLRIGIRSEKNPWRYTLDPEEVSRSAQYLMLQRAAVKWRNTMKLTLKPMIRLRLRPQHRKGVFFVLAIICLMGAMTFVGMSVDLGMITVTKTRMQAAADAAALAAAQEIVVAVREASWNADTGLDMNAVQTQAAADARVMAEYVADLNGFYLDPDTDVHLGKRLLAEDGVTYTETWETGPFNCVKVNLRKDNTDASAPDAKLPLLFAGVVGERAQSITTSATAFIESRDIVCTLDFSLSMNYDSRLRSSSVNRLTKSAIESNLDDIWNAFVNSDVRFSDESSTPKFPYNGFGLINSAEGTYSSSNNSNTVLEELGLYTPGSNYYDDWSFNSSGADYYYTSSGGYDYRRFTTGSNAGSLRRRSSRRSSWSTVSETLAPGYTPPTPEVVIPFPQEGKNSSTGLMLGKPSASTSKSLWTSYIDYVRTDKDLNAQGYRKRYGFRTLCLHLMVNRPSNNASEDLWRVPHYPFHAMKTGMTTFCRFMTDLSYGDHIGMVDYAAEAHLETGLNDASSGVTVDLGGHELTTAYSDINTIQLHKQAGHYSSSTATGDGLSTATALLQDQGRYGAQKAILLMTDGVPNVSPGNFNLPSNWNWNELLDYDGDGNADYTTNDRASKYALYQAKLAADQDIVVHTLCVGAGADTSLLKAIAKISGGYDMVVEGGTSVSDMESNLREAFGVLAGQVPPARLVVGAE